MSAEFRQDAAAVTPVRLQEYLRSRGWRLAEGPPPAGVAIYVREGLELDVPQRRDFADYARRVAEVLELVAAIEERSAAALLDDLTQPAGDVLGVRVRSETTQSGTLPLVASLQLREGTKKLLLASAHSIISPQSYFPRMSRSEATALLAKVREGPSQRGSFVTRFIVPTEPAVGEQKSFELEEQPYARRVMQLLMRALSAVHDVRSLGAYDELLSMERQGVSGNLLAALTDMAVAIGDGCLDLSVSWARNRLPPENAPSSVSFPAELLEGLDAVADQMRSRAQTKGFPIEGYVTRLDREAGVADAPGEVVIVPTSPDITELRRVSVHLDADSYEEAMKAHATGAPVQVVGTLRKEGRRWMLGDASGFERLLTDRSDEDDAGEA